MTSVYSVTHRYLDTFNLHSNGEKLTCIYDHQTHVTDNVEKVIKDFLLNQGYILLLSTACLVWLKCYIVSRREAKGPQSVVAVRSPQRLFSTAKRLSLGDANWTHLDTLYRKWCLYISSGSILFPNYVISSGDAILN